MKRKLKVLIACEESQRVCIEFRKLGHEAYSCDVQEPSGGHPEWAICDDVLPLLNGNCEFRTVDGAMHRIDGKFDLLICHPPAHFYPTLLHGITVCSIRRLTKSIAEP